MSLELRQLRHILALAEHGTFARAALALHLSQPALSRSIQGVEQQVGAELFVRSASGVVPTDIGRLFVQRARPLVQLADELDREILSGRSAAAGQVSVGAGPYPVESVLGPALARFLGRYPRVGVRLQVRNWDDLLQRLLARDLDFFVAEISTLQQEHDLDVEAMTEHPLFFAARRGHPLAGRGTVTAADTFAFPFVAPSRIPPRILEAMRKAQHEAAGPEGPARVFPSLECNAVSAVKHVVAGSDAITAVTLPCIAAELENGDFALLGAEPWLFVRYGLVSLKGQPLGLAAARLRELVVEAEHEACAEEARLRARWRPAPPAQRNA